MDLTVYALNLMYLEITLNGRITTLITLEWFKQCMNRINMYLERPLSSERIATLSTLDCFFSVYALN